MSPVDKLTIKNKLEKLEEIINILDKLKKTPKEDFLVDFRINGATMHFLVIGIEIIVDIGNHLVSAVFLKPEKTYKDVILALGKNKIVPEDFAKENSKMTDFRNLIIHAYAEVDLKQVYQNLQKAPDIFRKFAKYYLKFLEKLK